MLTKISRLNNKCNNYCCFFQKKGSADGGMYMYTETLSMLLFELMLFKSL